jgi:hypothetical protein
MCWRCLTPFVVALAVAALSAWAAESFLRGGRRFGAGERPAMVRYAARRYLAAWALSGPRRAHERIRGLVMAQEGVASVEFAQGDAGFTVTFADREQVTAQLPSLPPHALLPWPILSAALLLWAARVAWKFRRPAADGKPGDRPRPR